MSRRSNRTYADMAAHYDTAILPARPRRPRDKAKVEAAVLIVDFAYASPTASLRQRSGQFGRLEL